MTLPSRLDNMRVVRAPRGSELSAKSWLTEAPLRMLMNNLDPDVAERPGELVVYGGIGRAARDWNAFDQIVETLRRLEGDETLLVQSGKPVGVFRTHADAPRVLIANSNLVPHWATWDHFHELDRKGLMMYGQMTAGSWIYIGSQGIVQGTYETFVEMGRQHFGGSSEGQMDSDRRPRRHGRRAAAVGDHGRRFPARDRMPALQHRIPPAHRLSRRAGARPRRSAGDDFARDARGQGGLGRPASATRRKSCPNSCGAACGRTSSPTRPPRTIRSTAICRRAGPCRNGRSGAPAIPKAWSAPRAPRWPSTSARCSTFHTPACRPSTTATTSARWRWRRASKNAFDFPGFVPAYIRPLFCRGVGPFRWVALSGDPEDIYRTDAKVKELIPDNAHLHNWLDMARARIKFQGLPARICWVGLGRPRTGWASRSTRWWRRAS